MSVGMTIRLMYPLAPTGRRTYQRRPAVYERDDLAARVERTDFMAPTVIVPLDTSVESEASLGAAEALVRSTGGLLFFISVIEAPSEVGVWLNAHRTIDAWVDRHMEVDEYLTNVAARYPDLPTDTLVSTGNPSVEINLIAADQAEPVIVLASHARTGFSRMAVGSIATSVIHDARCPVIVVRRGEDEPYDQAPTSMKRLLVALDGSEFAESALSAAREVLGTSDLNLHLLRVVETTKWYGSTYAEFDYGVLDLYVQGERETASAYLEKQAKALEDTGHTVTWEICEGLVPDHIAAVSDEIDADLIVMSTHGRTGLGRVFMGSVAERVVHDAERPVMLVNPNVSSGDQAD